MREGDRAEPPVVRNKGKEHVISGDNDALTDDELSSERSSSTSPSPGRYARGSIRAKLRRKHSHSLALSDAVSGASRRAREQADRRKNHPPQAPRNASLLPDGMMLSMPPMHPAFSAGSAFYVQPTTLI